MALPTELLDATKNYLDIAWLDAQTDLKLTGIIERGMIFLNKKSGAILDYTTEGRAREMLMEYCRYTRDGVLNEFMINYMPMIKDLIIENGGTYGI